MEHRRLARRRLFREEAFARRGQTEPLDGLLRVTAPHEWVIVAGLGIALLGLVAWGLFGSVERSLSSECVLAQPGERYTVISDITGNVIDVPVDVGDPVEVGQPIAFIKIPELSPARGTRSRPALDSRSESRCGSRCPGPSPLGVAGVGVASGVRRGCCESVFRRGRCVQSRTGTGGCRSAWRSLRFGWDRRASWRRSPLYRPRAPESSKSA